MCAPRVLDVQEGAVERGQAVGFGGHGSDRSHSAGRSQPSTECVVTTFNKVCKMSAAPPCLAYLRTAPWTSATPPPSAAVYDEHARGVYGAALRILGDPARPRTSPRTSSCASGATRPLRRRGAASSARTCASWPAAARSTSGARARPPAAPATASSSSRPGGAARADERPVGGRRARRGPRRWSARRSRACPTPQREALVLAYWGGLTADQIARRSGVPLGTAKSRIRLGLSRSCARRSRPRARPREPLAA